MEHGKNSSLNDGESHPIESTNYLLGTPAVMSMKDAVFKWFECRLTGGMITGLPRWGKTCGIRFVALEFETECPGVAVLHHECSPYDSPREGPFFSELLKDIGHEMWRTGTNTEKVDRIISFIYDAAVRAPNVKCAVLFLDEAQNLTGVHYRWLVYLHNQLKRRGVYLFAVLVGQPELIHKRRSFRLARKTQYIARFMAMHEPFYGLRNEADVRACLQSYDTRSEYPPGSKISFTKHYCPAGFAGGWRLAKYAKNFWREFRRYSVHITEADRRIVPMENFCRAVEFVLKHLSKARYNYPAVMRDLIEAAVVASAYPESLDENGDPQS